MSDATDPLYGTEPAGRSVDHPPPQVHTVETVKERVSYSSICPVCGIHHHATDRDSVVVAIVNCSHAN